MKKWVLIIILFFCFDMNVNADEISTKVVDKDIVKLSKCIDGDTARFILNGEEIKVRFLAIDTPESTNKVEPYGKEAAKYTCNKLKNAKKIELEYDNNSDTFDKYNRYLAWIIVDDNNLQIDLVKKGYAEVKYIYGDYKYLKRLKHEQKIAKINKLNIWSTNNKDTMFYLYVYGGIVLILFLNFTHNKRVTKKIFNKVKKKIIGKL